MEAYDLDRMRQGLLHKQDGLTQWLSTTPPEKKEMLLGPSNEQEVHERLEVIDGAIFKADAKTLGQCEVCHEDVETELLEVDFTACVCIEHLSKAERRHLESDLELAQDVQKMLLPQEAPQIPGLEIAAFSRPAQIVGGDYFDFIDFSNGAHGLAIADVAGHGVSASLHMAGIQALLRALAPVSKSPAEVMRQIHKLFIHNIRFETFVTFFLAAFNPSTKTLAYCNAGHQPPLIVGENGGGKDPVVMLNPTGAAIGLVEEGGFGENTVELHTGDLLVLYTDGVTEASNLQAQEFGRARLAELSRQASHLPAKTIVQEIKMALEQFGEGQALADDTTLVVCKIN